MRPLALRYVPAARKGNRRFSGSEADDALTEHAPGAWLGLVGEGDAFSLRAWAIHPAYIICCCTVFEACLCMSAICHAFHPGGWEWARACGIFCALRPVGLRQQSRAYWCQIRCCCGYTRCGNDYIRYLPAVRGMAGTDEGRLVPGCTWGIL